MTVPIKYLSNFRKAFEIPLINFEINLVLTWPSICVITISTAAGVFAVTDTKLYVPVLTLWTPNIAKQLQQLKSSIKEQLTVIKTYQNYLPKGKTHI